LPARVVLMLLSPWHARHSAPGWSAARAGRCANSRENSVATSVARIILRPARHFLRPFFVSAIFASAMSNFRAGFINALQLPSGAKVRENWVVPPGLASVTVSQPGAEAPGYFQPSLRDLHLLPFRDPALKRRAIFSRPSGTCTFCRFATRR
jgi:hypothetical protein